ELSRSATTGLMRRNKRRAWVAVIYSITSSARASSGCVLRRHCRLSTPSDNHVHGQLNQLGREIRVALVVAFYEPHFQTQVLTFHISISTAKQRAGACVEDLDLQSEGGGSRLHIFHR